MLAYVKSLTLMNHIPSILTKSPLNIIERIQGAYKFQHTRPEDNRNKPFNLIRDLRGQTSVGRFTRPVAF